MISTAYILTHALDNKCSGHAADESAKSRKDT